MKKILAIIILTLVLGILITGCSSSSDEDKPATGEETPTPTTPEEKQVVSDINSELIDENEELDIGDVI